MRYFGPWVLVLAVATNTSPAQDDSAVKGHVEVTYRDTDLGGSRDKYREDVNLDDAALRLSDLRLEIAPEDRFFDRLRLEAQGLGGEPYTRARFGLMKANRYDLDVSFRESEHFYRDAGYFFREGGDLHTWDANRTFIDLALNVRLNDTLSLRAGADHSERDGGSTTSRTVQDEVFELERPIDQETSDYWVGADASIGWANLSVEQRFTTHENRWEQTARNTDGLDPGAAFLDRYHQLGLEDAEAPISRLKITGRPHERVGFSVGYARIDADLDFDTRGAWSGLDSMGAGFRTRLSSRGSAERQSDLYDFDVSIGLLGTLDLVLDYASRSYDQDGSIRLSETQTGGAGAGLYFVRGDLTNSLELDTYGATLDWRPMKSLGVAVGAGRQQRTKEFELSGPEIETERTVYRTRVRYRPHEVLMLRLDYEQGEDDDPVTPISMTESDRISVRADIRPLEGLGISVGYRDESKENELSTTIGLPTDDMPPVDEVSRAVFDVTAWDLGVTWSWKELDVSAGYTRTEIESDAHIIFVTGSTLVPTFDIFTTRRSTGYLAEQDLYHATVRYAFGKRWATSVRGVMYDSEGTFPVDSVRYGADVRYDIRPDLWVRGAYDRYDHDEDNPYAGDPAMRTPDVNDYDADLISFGIGYSF